jgi:hypothetical protein
VRVADDALDQRTVVRARERFAFAKSERPTATQIWNASLVLGGGVFLDGRQDEVGNVMMLRASRGHAELKPARFDPRLEERPAQCKKHELRVAPPKGRSPVRIVEKLDALFGGHGLELFADETDAHLDLFQPG